ncbi:M50 family metallopeptidase [Candidatus Woesearchaeota archaeon]|nr:M50 family metallopeptidase [Candidatus Woesearchaeota archaeon]
MALFNIPELIDLVIMAVGLGIIFMGFFGNRPRDARSYGKAKPLNADLYPKKRFLGFDIDEFKYAVLAIAPAIILHEMAHKFVAMGFGLHATFQAFIPGLVFGIILKIINPGFVIFIPGYVSIIGSTEALNTALIAFAGPAVHLAFWLVSIYILKTRKLKPSHAYFWTIQKKINLFLFVFNMIPIRPFDGYSVFSNLIKVVF